MFKLVSKVNFERYEEAKRYVENQGIGKRVKIRLKKNYPYGRKSRPRKMYWSCYVYREVKK